MASDPAVVQLLTEIRDCLRGTPRTPRPQPSETALSGAYQVAARMLATESQLIWGRTSLLVGVNALIVAVVQALGRQPPGQVATGQPAALLYVGLSVFGMFYSVLQYLALHRAWGYRDFQIAVLRDLEGSLSLGSLALFTTGREAAEGRGDRQIGGMRARTFVNILTITFVLVHLASGLYLSCRL